MKTDEVIVLSAVFGCVVHWPWGTSMFLISALTFFNRGANVSDSAFSQRWKMMKIGNGGSPLSSPPVMVRIKLVHSVL